ncbi:hypothetical protein [Streptomyces sp. NPDC056527]|uniref:hypothetical protein n=1 Tax=Streptomyces sp. NPDC056527 TaxID=3345853 RepID=UPI0036AF4139
MGATRTYVETGGGTQPGDPAKAAAAVVKALDAEETPLRLALGGDSIDTILGHLEQVRGDLPRGRRWAGTRSWTAADKRSWAVVPLERNDCPRRVWCS